MSDRTTAVQYTKIPLPATIAAGLRSREKQTLALGVEHPAYSARAILPPRTVEEIEHDLD
jgi:hypothetical protein